MVMVVVVVVVVVVELRIWSSNSASLNSSSSSSSSSSGGVHYVAGRIILKHIQTFCSCREGSFSSPQAPQMLMWGHHVGFLDGMTQ